MLLKRLQDRFYFFWKNYLNLLKIESEFGDDLKLALSGASLTDNSYKSYLDDLGYIKLIKNIIRFLYRCLRGVLGKYTRNRFHMYRETIYLATTNVHYSVANFILKQNKSSWKYTRCLAQGSNLFERVFCIFDILRAIYFFSRNLNQLSLNKKYKIRIIVNYSCEIIVSSFIQLELHILKNKYHFKEICCFEFGFIAHAISSFKRKNKTVKIIYMQHGFHSVNVPVFTFDQYYLWKTWDFDFYHDIYAVSRKKIILTKVELIKNNLISSSVHINNQLDTVKEVLLILEYPTAKYSINKMLNWWSEIVEQLLEKGYCITVKPHPRDRSKWYFPLIKKNKSIVVLEAPIELNFLLQQKIYNLIITIASASIVDVVYPKTKVLFYEDQSRYSIIFPFEEFAIPLANSAELHKHV